MSEPHAWSGASSRRAASAPLISVAVNLALAVIKVAAGVLGFSYALIADGIESALDIVGSLVVWRALRMAERPPDAGHPYGHGKAEALAGAAVATFLLAAAAAIAVQSVLEIITPHRAPAPFTLGVLVGVIVTKEALFRFLHRRGVEAHSTALRTDAWHQRADSLTSAAAFVGITVALVAGEGYEAADDWAALVACAVIAYNGIGLLRDAVGQIMDAAPPEGFVEAVCGAAAGVEEVRGVPRCRVRRSGLIYLVDIHIAVDPDISVRRGHAIAHRVQDALVAGGLRVADVVVHVEPAELAEGAADAAAPTGRKGDGDAGRQPG